MNNSLLLLIVDDDADDRNLLVKAIKEVDSRIECISANDGMNALEILNIEEKKLPDFIFLDLRMPRFNGKKFLTEIKKDERLKNIPVIIYTTSRELEESQDMKSMGAVYFISKPHNPEEIYYILSYVLEQELNALHRDY